MTHFKLILVPRSEYEMHCQAVLARDQRSEELDHPACRHQDKDCIAVITEHSHYLHQYEIPINIH